MSPPPERRRRLSSESDSESEGRRGCVTVGAVLGVLLGIVLGIFVLPGVLDSFLAGEEIAVGGTYSGDGRTISLEKILTGEDAVILEDGTTAAGTRIELNVLSRKTWLIESAFFQLELSARDNWIEAMEAVPAEPGTSLDFTLGQSRILVLQFKHNSDGGEPVFLHLSDPSIRLELRQEGE